jgi:hypothetical protein
VILQDFHDVGNSRSLLTDSDVNAVKLLGLFSAALSEGTLLVDDSINSNSGFTSLSISDNELSLSSSNWDQ